MGNWLRMSPGFLRPILRRPGFALIVVLILSFGIGANATTFAMVDAMLWRPLPFHDSGRLVHIWRVDRALTGVLSLQRLSQPDFVDFKARVRSFTDLGAFLYSEYSVAAQGVPERLQGTSVSVGLFEILGVPPMEGRTFRDTEDVSGGRRVTMLSAAFATRLFGSPAQAIGQRVTINSEPYEVVGVMPASFRFPLATTRFWLPLARDIQGTGRDIPFAQVIGRVKPDVPFERAADELRVISQTLSGEHADRVVPLTVTMVPLRQALLFYFDAMRGMLFVLSIGSILILLIVCSSAASLMLANGLAREPELAMRAALGASRATLIKHLVAEAGLLAAAAAAIGVAFAWAATRLLDARLPETLYRVGTIGIDRRTLVFLVIVAAASVVLSGVRPALKSARRAVPTRAYENHASLAARGRAGGRFIVAFQSAVSVVLTTVALLLVSIVVGLRQGPMGFETKGILTGTFNLPVTTYPDDEAIQRFDRTLLEAARRLPGVRATALVSPLPLTFQTDGMQFLLDKEAVNSPETHTALTLRVTDAYFEAMGIPILSGRTFQSSDRAGTLPVIVINRAMARRYWANADPVGQRITDCSACTPQQSRSSGVLTIVGVVGDAKQSTTWDVVQPQVYLPQSQTPTRAATVVIRTDGDAAALAAPLRAAARDIDPHLALGLVQPMSSVVENSLQPVPLVATALTAMAVGVVFLAAVGIYGLLSRLAQQHTREMGIRIALGGSRAAIYWLVLGYGIRPALAGVSVGGVLSVLVFTAIVRAGAAAAGDSGAVPSLVSMAGPPLMVVGVLLVVVLAACHGPAWRVTRVDPAVSLRHV